MAGYSFGIVAIYGGHLNKWLMMQGQAGLAKVGVTLAGLLYILAHREDTVVAHEGGFWARDMRQPLKQCCQSASINIETWN